MADGCHGPTSGLLLAGVVFGLAIAARELGPTGASWTPIAVVAIRALSATAAVFVPGVAAVRSVTVLITVDEPRVSSFSSSAVHTATNRTSLQPWSLSESCKLLLLSVGQG